LAVVGGLVVAVGTERVRWSREDRLRWVATQREACSAFIAAIDRWDQLDHHAALGGEVEPWHEAPADDRDALLGTPTSRLRPLVARAATEAWQRYTDLQLIGAEPIVQHARALYDKTRDLSQVRYQMPPRSCGGISDDLWNAEMAHAGQRSELVAAVRAELGAGSGSGAPARRGVRRRATSSSG
jgi:hypothetical protein